MESQYTAIFASLGRSVPSLMFESGFFAKAILLILFVSSVICWAIIYDRIRLYTKLKRGGQKLHSIVASKGLGFSSDTLKSCLPSIEGALLLEAKRYLESNKAGGADAGRPGRLKDLLERRAVTEVSEMEKYLVFLATTAAVAPFFGLLGTVWGIATSFLSMGVHGTASIDIVGPGIAEALITTIAGLGAAIPAVIGYNLLLRHVRRQENRIELFLARILELTQTRLAGDDGGKRESNYEENPV